MMPAVPISNEASISEFWLERGQLRASLTPFLKLSNGGDLAP